MKNRLPSTLCLPALFMVAGCTFLSSQEPDPAKIQQLIENAQPEMPIPPTVSPSDSTRSFDPIEGYPDWDLEQTAADALGRIGAPAVPALVSALRNGDSQRRHRALRVLARIGPEANSAVPPLIDALHDTDPLIRKAAARALGQIGPEAAEAVPALMELLHEEEKQGSGRGDKVEG